MAKKTFLLPLATAISALITSNASGQSAIDQTAHDPQQPSNSGPTVMSDVKSSIPDQPGTSSILLVPSKGDLFKFILRREGDNRLYADHESHYSHQSHSSHRSHYSGQ